MTETEKKRLSFVNQVLINCGDCIVVKYLPMSPDRLHAHPELIDVILDYLGDELSVHGFDENYNATQYGSYIEDVIDYINSFRAIQGEGK